MERDDGIEVHEGRKAGVTVSVRLRPEEAEKLVALSQRYGTTLSETLRLAVGSLAQATDYTALSLQSSGLGQFTRAEFADEDLLVTQ